MNKFRGNNNFYNDYSSFIKNNFKERIQKISLNVGFTCPNRDGSKGLGGCTYCNNLSFNPLYCKPEKSISEQLDEGIKFFSKHYNAQKYFAYFQAYTNTYATFDVLKPLYLEALSHSQVVGLVIATRPDCINDEILNYLAKLKKYFYITVEYGIESTNDKTLEFINRRHSFLDSQKAILLTASYNIPVGAHLIIGLPNESRSEILNHATEISKLPINTLKLHQLQILKGTPIAEQYATTPEIFPCYTLDEYIDLVIDFVELLNPAIVIERFISESPAELIINNKWGLKNFEIVSKIVARMKVRGSWQGKKFEPVEQ